MEYQYSVVYHYNSSLMILNEQLALPVQFTKPQLHSIVAMHTAHP